MGSHKKYALCLEIGCEVVVGAQVIAEQFGAQKVIAKDIDPELIEIANKNLMPE